MGDVWFSTHRKYFLKSSLLALQYARTAVARERKGESSLPSNFLGFTAFMSMSLTSSRPRPTDEDAAVRRTSSDN